MVISQRSNNKTSSDTHKPPETCKVCQQWLHIGKDASVIHYYSKSSVSRASVTVLSKIPNASIHSQVLDQANWPGSSHNPATGSTALPELRGSTKLGPALAVQWMSATHPTDVPDTLFPITPKAPSRHRCWAGLPESTWIPKCCCSPVRHIDTSQSEATRDKCVCEFSFRDFVTLNCQI